MRVKEEQFLKSYFKRKVSWSEAILVLFLITGTLSYSETIEEAKRQIADNNILEAGNYEGEVGNGSYISTKNDTKLNGEVNVNAKTTGGESYIELSGNNNIIDTLNINISPKENVNYVYPKGLIIRGNSNATINNLNSNVTFAKRNSSFEGSADSVASYGVAVGYNHNGGASSDLAKLIVNNMNINVTNTPDTISSPRTVSKKIFFISVTATVDFRHQLSGLKVYKTNGAKAEFEANGDVNIKVSDSSSKKIGDYLVGVYVSGEGSKATFNGNTNIVVEANGVNSAGIKIGKPFDNITGDGASVIANGKLVVDTTKTEDSAAVRLFDNKSKFEITGANTEDVSEIKSGNSAIVFDTKDYVLNFETNISEKNNVSRNSNANEQIVKLKNTQLTTLSEIASLILVKSEKVTDPTFGQASKFSNQLNSGDFSVENASFLLTGEKSSAVATDKGWLIEVQGVDKKPASLVSNIENGAKIEGLVHKEEKSVHNLILKDNASWKLKPKLEEKSSTLSNLTLENSLLDASFKNIPETTEVLPKEFLDKIKEAEENLELASLYKEISPDDENVIANYNDALRKKEEAKKELEDYRTENPFVPEPPKADYIIKLSSDGKLSDGKFINDGIITMANDSYNDKLTIAGNYVSNSGKLKVNTLWDSPVDETNKNSKSDLLEIEGGAIGKTEIIAVNIDGKEGYIDGTIGSIKDDLNKNSAVVVRVKDITVGNNRAFEGKAKTSGVGELEIAEREENGNREYFWTITSLNKEKTPIYSKIISSYVQMPKINKELAYSSLRTLHERKSENQIFTWENLVKEKENKNQIWARLIGNKIEAKGKERLNFNSKIKGIQVGNEFAIDYKNDKYILKGGYLSFQEANSKFYDRYKTEAGKIVGNKYTGNGKSEAISLGITRTSYKIDGQYLDLVGQVSFIKNKYEALDKEKAKNKALSLLFSIETGKPYLIKENINKNKELIIEPQGQLIYQNIKMKNFSDEYRKINQKNDNSLRGRLGFRLSYNDKFSTLNEKTKSYYAIFNVWHDFIKDGAVKIGKDTIRERYSSTIWEAGLGMQLPISEKSHLYADVRYNKSLMSTKYKSYIGTVGIKYTF